MTDNKELSNLMESKANRLELLRKIGRANEEKYNLTFGELATSKQEVEETVHDMDTWREESRQNRGEALTADER